MSKIISILSYLTIFGWFIAFILKKTQKDIESSTENHLEQGIGLAVVGFISSIFARFIPEIWYYPGRIIAFTLLIFLIIGVINAASDKNQPLPLIGSLFQGKFPFVK